MLHVTSTTTQRPAAPAAGPSAGRSVLVGAVTGLVSLGAFLAVAELAAAVVGPASAPAVAIGQTAIDAAPHQLKDYAVRTFGTADKPILLAGVFTVLAVLAALAGAASTRRLRYGLGALVLLTGVTAALAVSRPSGRAADAVPALLGGLVAAAALTTLRQRRAGDDGAERAVSRRTLLGYGLAWTAAAAAAATVGRQLLAGASRATASRLAVVLPPVRSAAPAPVGDPQAAGASPFRTPNADFYRVDTALTVPQVDAATWRLRLHGMVDRPATFSFDQLLAMPLVERDITLTCVSNEVGGPYVGTARWTGVPLGPLLEAAGLQPGATQLLSRSVDGWTCGTPVEVVTDGRDALLAVAMNGAPLPLEHGFPVRMVVPGLYGYVSATKWLTDLEVTTFEKKKAYWTTRGYAEQAPIKVSSRIDTPKPFAPVQHGRVAVAGVAWAQHTGIAKVEVSVDGGPWQAARLAGEDGVDTWRQWVFPWDATPGAHRLSVRATDKAGRLQDAVRRPVYPDGATGRQELVVTVT
jgi:DMSO/TMAO reductase YedYZ molybdopterin-dependent catalytic subunit